MLHQEVLIVKLSAIDRLAASPVKIFKIPSLKHELWNDSVEDGVPVCEPLLIISCCYAVEIPCCSGNNFVEQLHVNLSIIFTVHVYTEIHL